jgi:hypothetical protein
MKLHNGTARIRKSRKAARNLDRAIVKEGYADCVTAPEAVKENITYRVIVATQYYENYGAHDWDGQGECPQYWKAKGGSDFIVAEGLSEYDFLTRSPEEFVPQGIEHRSNYSETSIVGVYFLPSNVPTYEERMIADFAKWGQPMRQAEIDYMNQSTRRFMVLASADR